MKTWVLFGALLCCAALVSCGRSSGHSSSSSDSSDSSEDTSESHSHSGHRHFRSASCDLRAAPSSNVRGYLHIYQKRAGDTVWIKGGLRGLGPSGTTYDLAFHKGYPSPGECDRAGETLEGVGGDFAHVSAQGNNSGAGVRVPFNSITLEEGHSNSVIGRSIVVRNSSTGSRVACCTVDRTRERHNY